MPDLQPEKYYTLSEVAKRLKLSTRTVRRKLSTQELSGFKIGNQWRFTENHIRSFVRRQSSRPEQKSA